MTRSNRYLPEGRLLDTPENREATASVTALMQAREDGTLLEARAVRCDAEHNLYVRFPFGEGIIPREEGAEGIAEGDTRDIALITRVNKPVAFLVTGFEQTEAGCRPVLSRRLAQQRCREEYLDHLRLGDIIPAHVTRLDSFGAFCDIGCGLPALFPIAELSVSRISHPGDRLTPGQDVMGVVHSIAERRICLSLKELLGTWEENAAQFRPGETVAGIIRSVEPYGVFVELAPNLAGLAEPYPGAKSGQHAAVFIKSITPERMKIKLVIIDAEDCQTPPAPVRYFIENGRIDHWRYSPEGAPRLIESRYDQG